MASEQTIDMSERKYDNAAKEAHIAGSSNKAKPISELDKQVGREVTDKIGIDDLAKGAAVVISSLWCSTPLKHKRSETSVGAGQSEPHEEESMREAEPCVWL